MCKVLAALFANIGHEVLGAFPDGEGLEDKVSSLKPDLLCLDYQLPGRDGLTLLRAVLAVAPTLDVVFMTASAEPEIDARAAEAGAAGFIRKPFGQAQIIAELKALENNRRLARSAQAGGLQAAGKPKRGQYGTAVIADDNGSVRLVLKAMLEESGLQVIQAVTNGAEAVRAAETHKPRVLCLDVNMPVMGGLEALSKIREVSPETLVIMVTGEAEKQVVTQAAGLGAVGYIVKPLRQSYVEGFIQKLLGSSSQ